MLGPGRLMWRTEMSLSASKQLGLVLLPGIQVATALHWIGRPEEIVVISELRVSTVMERFLMVEEWQG